MKKQKYLRVVNEGEHGGDYYAAIVRGIVKTDNGGYAVVVELPFMSYQTANEVAMEIMGNK